MVRRQIFAVSNRRWRFGLVLAAGMSIFGVGAPAADRSEEFCLLIEPREGPQVVKPIAGARRTGLVPGRQTNIGVRYYTADEYRALGVEWPEFLRRAEASAARQLAKLEPEIVKDEKGFARYAVLKGKSHLTATAVLARNFRDLFKKSMGDDLVVLVPNRFTIYVWPRAMGEYKEFGRRILEEYESSPHPVSYEVLLLNRDGLSCLGSFRNQ